MARSLWTGSLSFGLVNVPVALFTAVRDRDLHFHELHEKDAARIDTRRFCEQEDKEIPLDEIGHAYDLDGGKTVVVTDEDLQAVAPRKTRTIDIEAFVDLADIDPVYFDHPYFLAPTGDSEGPRRAYQLLVEGMGASDRVALGRFVMRTKEYLVAIQVRDERRTNELRHRYLALLLDGLHTRAATPLPGPVPTGTEYDEYWDLRRVADERPGTHSPAAP